MLTRISQQVSSEFTELLNAKKDINTSTAKQPTQETWQEMSPTSMVRQVRWLWVLL